jgi:hypothetical protein
MLSLHNTSRIATSVRGHTVRHTFLPDAVLNRTKTKFLALLRGATYSNGLRDRQTFLGTYCFVQVRIRSAQQ